MAEYLNVSLVKDDRYVLCHYKFGTESFVSTQIPKSVALGPKEGVIKYFLPILTVLPTTTILPFHIYYNFVDSSVVHITGAINNGQIPRTITHLVKETIEYTFPTD